MTLKDFMLATAAAALIAGGAVAQTETVTPEDPNAPVAEGAAEAETPTVPDAGATLAPEAEMAEVPTSLDQMTVNDVLGRTVTGIDDETIGDIDYVVGSADSISFVIGIGGFLGIGEYTVALPMDQFSLDADGGLKLSSMTKEDLKAQPEFDESTAESLPGDMILGSAS